MKPRFSLHSLLAFLVLLSVSVAAQAQATRTWVSGVGDDANPCSRTAPCKTFAGAISKTATNGEINVLDPGGFGGVTITKGITISSEGFEAGVLVSGTNAIIVNAPTTATVILRGLDIEGLGTGLAGIRVLAVGALHVENCTINNFTQKGIDFEPTSAVVATSQLHVSNTIIRNNVGASSGGIFIKPGSTVSVNAMIENTQLRNNLYGIRIEDGVRATAKSTTAVGNSNAGFLSVSTTATGAFLSLDSCVSRGNANGIKADGSNSTIRIAATTIADNTSGLVTTLGGHIVSFLNNNNADTGAPTGTIPQQ